MPVNAAMINTGGGGGGLSSIPGGWRTAAIGGGIVLALIAVVLQRSGSAGAVPASGGGLSTSANVALGQVAYEQRTAANESKTRDAEMSGQLANLLGLSTDAFAALWGQGQAGQILQIQYGEDITRGLHGITTQGMIDRDPGNSDFYARQQGAFSDASIANANRAIDALAAPPPWMTSVASAAGPLDTESVDDEPGVAVATSAIASDPLKVRY